MAECSETPLVCILGPTATGKSALAEALCRALDGEVVSADSMQVYRGMDIGTAKVAPRNRTVPYHCIDIVDPGSPYSAALFQHDARCAIADIRSRGKLPLLCGGTGLYVRAVVDEMVFAAGEQEGNEVRERYSELARELGPMRLHDLLREKDPESAALIHPNNVIRVVRAFEMLEQGESYARRKDAFKNIKPYMECVKIALRVDTDRLNARIDARVDAMMDEGLLNEVEGLVASGFRDALTSSKAIGYRELVEYLDGACSLCEAIERIKRSTRRYAKRQRTWLRSERDVAWLDVNEGLTDRVLSHALELVKAKR